MEPLWAIDIICNRFNAHSINIIIVIIIIITV
jgi:hypothetical protein